MRLKRSLAFVVSSTMALLLATATGTASGGTVDPGTASPPAACASPPSDPNATDANRDSFIKAWLPRISDQAWFDNFVKLDSLPSNIASEPYFSMSGDVQAWLVACLVDNAVSVAGESATSAQIANYQIGLDFAIFGKAQIAKLRQEATKSSQPLPNEQGSSQATDELNATQQELASQPSLTTADLPKADVTTPATTSSADLLGQASDRLQSLVGAHAPTPNTSFNTPTNSSAATPATVDPNSLLNQLTLEGIINTPVVALLLSALNDLLQLIAKIQQVLFTLPGVNLLSSAFYRVCAESATQPLACSISLPVGVPNLIDVNGDHFPDMTVDLLPLINGSSLGVQVYMAKLLTATGPLPAHVYIVYDTPIVKKRIEFGYDGRASTLANETNTTVYIKNILKALTGDVDVTANVTSHQPGSTEAMTFAIKDLVGGSIGVPPSEANPTAGAVQFSPFPTSLSAEAHLVHTSSQDEDTLSLNSSTPSTVNALVDQDTTTTTPQSHREFSALIDQLPTSVNVDLLHQGGTQTITYTASAPIAHVHATDTATPDVSQPGSFTQSQYDVLGVPASVQVQLQGAQDIKYTASASVPQASFSTRTLHNGELEQQIVAQANQIPSTMHVSDVTGADQTAVTYDANAVLGSVQLSMYDRSQDKTNLVASATAIPTHIQFTQNKSAGVFDFLANAGIGLIKADLTRGGDNPTVLQLPGDHATVYQRGTELGLELQLTGFKSAHFDGSQKTIVSLGLDPGGQSFDAVADLDATGGPNVLAKAHISALPSSMSVTIDPVGGAATYTASSVIPELDGSFLQRDTQTFAGFTLHGLPKNIGLTFNTTAGAPQITYTADSRLGSIEGFYQKAPGDLAFHALISDLPQYMSIHGQDPIAFDARTSATDPSGSSFIGQALFQYATDGTFESPPTSDDHIYLRTTGGQTHAELLYSGLEYLSVNTSGGALHAEIKNSAARLLRAYLTTDTLTLTGFIDKVPDDVKIDQVGNDVQYHASSTIHEIYTNVQRAGGDALEVDVNDIPAAIDVTFDAANSHLGWNASGPTGGISVLAHLTAATLAASRAFDAALTITGIPSHWTADYGNGNVDFEAGGTGIGAISAQVTNHGSYHVLPGDHLNAYYDKSSGDLDASLHISNLTKAAFNKLTDGNGGGFTADLNMGNHGTFNLGAQIYLDSNEVVASGSFDHLPSTIHLSSDGGRIQYSGNDNPTLTLSLAAGDDTALSATPLPTNVHGLSIRDGANGSARAVRANLYITGLPDSLDLNSPAGIYKVGNFHPSVDPLALDIKLTTLASQPLSLEVTQDVGTSSPVSFTFGPFTSSTDGSGNSQLGLSYTASRAMGQLTAEATYGGDPATADDAKLVISEIPASIAVNASFGDQKSVTVAMSQGISDIKASYKHVGDTSFAACVHLHDVPSAVNLLLGRDSGGDSNNNVSTPDFTFTASSPGLDIDAFANAEIGTTADAAATLKVVNLGQTVTGQLDGTSLKVTSSPKTDSFLLRASGAIHLNVNLGFDVGPFHNTGSLQVDITIHSLTLSFDNTSTLQLDLGITTGLKGDFTNFTFGLDTSTSITIQDSLDFSIGTPFGDASFNIFNIPSETHIPLGNVIDHFRLLTNRSETLFTIDVIDVGLGYCGFDVNVRPFPDHSTTGSEFSVGPPPSDGTNPAAWLIVPDPNFLGFSLPDFAIDIIAYFTSPYGHDLSGGLGCHSRI